MAAGPAEPITNAAEALGPMTDGRTWFDRKRELPGPPAPV